MKRTIFYWMCTLMMTTVVAQQPAPALAPNAGSGFEGNWEITFQDSPDKGAKAVHYFSVSRDWPMNTDAEFAKGVGVGHSRPPRKWIRTRDPNSPLIYTGAHNRNANGNVGPVVPEGDGSLKFKHPYGMLGHWGGTSEVHVAGPNSVTGRWTYNDKSGTESWRRVLPRITDIEFSSKIESKVKFGGEVGQMETVYSADDWAAGNRPGFEVRIYGENLWGYHRVWIDGEGIQAKDPGTIGADPKDPSKPHNVIGIQFGGNFWSAASPGRKVLHVDDMEIPFDLEVKGYPEAKKPAVPELRFVRFSNGKYEPVAELRHGDEFCVEATYTTKPAQAPGKVQLSWTDGQPREVEVVATEDAKLFRSAKMKLEPPAAP